MLHFSYQHLNPICVESPMCSLATRSNILDRRPKLIAVAEKTAALQTSNFALWAPAFLFLSTLLSLSPFPTDTLSVPPRHPFQHPGMVLATLMVHVLCFLYFPGAILSTFDTA